MAKMNKVCVNIDQSNANNGGFSDAEKLQARKNIGAGVGAGVKLVYLTSTFAEVEAVLSSGIYPLLRVGNANNGRYYVFSYSSPGSIVFSTVEEKSVQTYTIDANDDWTPASYAFPSQPSERIAYNDWSSQGNNAFPGIANGHWVMPVYTSASDWETVYIPVQPGQTLVVNFACVSSIPNASVALQLVPSSELHGETSGANSDYTFTVLAGVQLGICSGEHFATLVWKNTGSSAQTVALILKNLTGQQLDFSTTRTTAVTF